MPHLKLSYFDFRGRGESIRLALAIGGLPFEDDRISSNWPAVKPSTPYGSVPVLRIDHVHTAAQSNAILRYIGKLTGLYPADPLQALQVDEVLDTVAECIAAFAKGGGKKGEELRIEREKTIERDVPRYFGALDRRMRGFGKHVWAVGDSITVADLAVFNLYLIVKGGVFDFVGEDVLDGYEKAFAVYEQVGKHPKVIDWYEKNPPK